MAEEIIEYSTVTVVEVIEETANMPVETITETLGFQGDDGLSAYEVAVANGFVGNQAAWLASLVGPAGGGGGGTSGFSIGATTPVTAGEYFWVQTDGAGNFIDLIVGTN